MKITLAQLDPIIGDFDGNYDKLLHALERAARDQSDLIVFPELYLCGYPPRDLLERKDFLAKAEQYLNYVQKVSNNYPGLGILVGTIMPSHQKWGHGLYNSGILIEQGNILFTQHKSLLPTYDVFDEARYFDPAADIDVFHYKGEVLGITICEDAWNDPDFLPQKGYAVNPLDILHQKGATLFLNLSSSPFYIGKPKARYRLIQNHIRKYHIPFCFVNQVAGNDELIFDGNSLLLNQNGGLLCQLNAFKPQLHTLSLKTETPVISFQPQPETESLYHALILGLKDYVKKCGFDQVVLGLSGGIDSAVVCVLAAHALGPENVLAVAMPSQYSSDHSVRDAEKLSHNLSIAYIRIPISAVFNAYLNEIKPHFQNLPENEAEENIQARIRGDIIMALSNKFRRLALSTGNKSEMAVGYCTLYGDMSGGLNVIADVPKMMVYKLAEYMNRNGEIIPNHIITKPPSAELKPDQKDQDTLPPYEILDRILYLYLDERKTKDEILQEGFDQDTINWIIKTFNRNEYKRRQAAPGLKVTSKAFGMGRRMPIAAYY